MTLEELQKLVDEAPVTREAPFRWSFPCGTDKEPAVEFYTAARTELPKLIARQRKLEAVAMEAKKNPCRHDASTDGLSCRLCIALAELERE